MKKTFALVFSLIFISPLFLNAQKKDLSLKDAVMQQYRKFYPDFVRSFQWIPNKNEYSFTEKQSLYTASIKNQKKIEIATIQEVNENLKAELYGFYSLKWKDENKAFLNDGRNYYCYDFSTKRGKTLFSIKDNTGGNTFNENSLMTAYTIDNNIWISGTKGKVIEVTKFKDKNIVAGQAFARSEFGITKGLFWSKDGALLAFYQKDESKVHDYPLLNINKTPGELKAVKYPMAGQTSEMPCIGIFNVEKQKTNYIKPRGAKDNYLTNISFTPDNKHVLIAEVNRDQNHMWLNLYKTTGEFVKTLIEEENSRWVEPEHPAYFPNKDNSNFIWISEKSGFNNLYYYNIDGELIKQLTNHDFVVKDILSSKNNNIYYSATGENPMNTLIYCVGLDGKKQKLLTPNEGTHSFSLSSNGKYFYDRYSNGKVPNKSLIWTMNGKMAKLVNLAKDKLEEYTLGSTEVGSINSVDNKKLYYRMIKPSNFDENKKYPVLVYVYGGPHAQLVTNSWLNGASLWMHWMAEQGYIVYTLDNRGSASRGFEFESGIHRQLGTLEIEDQLLGVQMLKNLRYVDGDRIAVHGWSFGGFMTTSLMLREPGVFTTGVAGGPVTDWKYYEVMYGERYMDRPEDNEKGYEAASLINKTDNLEGNLLLIHGTSDDVVVMQHNLMLVKKFIESEKQIDFFPYPMHKHNVYGKDRVHLMTKILNYIIENNK